MLFGPQESNYLPIVDIMIIYADIIYNYNMLILELRLNHYSIRVDFILDMIDL